VIFILKEKRNTKKAKMHQPISFSLSLNFYICDSFENPKPCDEHGAYIIFIMTDVRE